MRRLITAFRLTNVIPERIIFVSQGITVYDGSGRAGSVSFLKQMEGMESTGPVRKLTISVPEYALLVFSCRRMQYQPPKRLHYASHTVQKCFKVFPILY